MLQSPINAHRRNRFATLIRTMALAGAVAAAAVGTVPAQAQKGGGPISGLTSQYGAVGVFRPSKSVFAVDGNFDRITDYRVVYGSPGDVGLLGDVTGSGTRAPILFNNGIWKVDKNRDGVVDVSENIYFGGMGDIPLVGDVNGDGKEDLVVYRNGMWLVSYQSNGAVDYVFQFGFPGDVPMLADIDGDGRVDFIIYRNGQWLISTQRVSNQVDLVYNFGGQPGDKPIAFDYNGDGKADLAVYRNGLWAVSINRNGMTDATFNWGQPGDQPLYFGPGAVSTPQLDAARFLYQASFGPTQAEIDNVVRMGIPAYLEQQLNMPATNLPAFAFAPASQPANCTSPLTAGGPADPYGTNCPRDLYSQFAVQRYFLQNALTAPDQLRQRVAWALSQIWVTSAAQDPIAYGNRDYQQMLIDNAFTNFGIIMIGATTSPFMGNYLDMVNNAKANVAAGTNPNENYAREILQLFSVGLFELNQDGTLLTDATGNPIPTYDQTDISQLAKVFTGWTYPPRPGSTASWNAPVNYQTWMIPFENFHDRGTKTFLGSSFPANVDTTPEIQSVVTGIFYHPNVPPFISKQLIQRLVTSNPSASYVGRVAAVFTNNGQGVRGDLKAVVRAILLDPEARAPRNPAYSTFGKLKEPVLHITNFLRTIGATSDGVYSVLQLPNLGQNIYTSPTVFNYYPADYVVPGTTLAGPEFGIHDATYFFARTNFFWNLVFSGTCDAAVNVCGPAADTTVTGALGTKMNFASLKAVAVDPVALVGAVDKLLLHGTMPRFMRDQIATAVAAYPSATETDRANRVRTALYLTAISPRYMVEF